MLLSALLSSCVLQCVFLEYLGEAPFHIQGRKPEKVHIHLGFYLIVKFYSTVEKRKVDCCKRPLEKYKYVQTIAPSSLVTPALVEEWLSWGSQPEVLPVIRC